ncbi:MAG: SUMO ligase siz1 [Bogoriella megaspora]|nr:MAG: SUMO ligase siz1 [Bogoriella megaspora]
MASGHRDIQAEVNKLSREIKTLLNNDLKEICRAEGLPVSGVKATLQRRILERLDEVVISGDIAVLDRIKPNVRGHRAPSPVTNQDFGQPRSSSSAYNTSSPNMPGYKPYGSAFTASSRPSGMQSEGPDDLLSFQTRRINRLVARRTPGFNNCPTSRSKANNLSASLQFKKSPFYEIVVPLTRIVDLPAMSSHRNTVTEQLTLSQETVTRLRNDPSHRIFLFCCLESYDILHDIAFPSQIEVKINNDEVKSNFKGLKNKPGTTRPADITDSVRKTAGYNNSLSVTYALTQKVRASLNNRRSLGERPVANHGHWPAHQEIERCSRANIKQKFQYLVNLVKKVSVQDLKEKIKRRGVITKQRVLDEMISKANDPDIVATSSVMSLKDPVSYLRIQTPCRSSVCTHNQCFDVESFLQLQEQAPTWTCPICNKIVSFEALSVDQYVQDILQSTSSDQVTIEPNGSWSSGDNLSGPGTNGSFEDDDSDEDNDDLVDITESRVNQIKKEEPTSANPFSVTARTPPLTSRETSSAPQTNSNKRKRSEVIDLTLSDEDDDSPPIRPAKRHAPGVGSTPANPSKSAFTPSSNPSGTRNGFSGTNNGRVSTTPGFAAPSKPSNGTPFSSSNYKNRPPYVPPPPIQHPPSSQNQNHPPPPSAASFSPSLHLPGSNNGPSPFAALGSNNPRNGSGPGFQYHHGGGTRRLKKGKKVEKKNQDEDEDEDEDDGGVYLRTRASAWKKNLWGLVDDDDDEDEDYEE